MTSINELFIKACKNGNKERVLLMIENGADNWWDGLAHACEGGHKEIALMMIEKGADNWNCGLYASCLGGHKEMAELMIESALKASENGADLNWNNGLNGACDGGHKELALLMIEKGADGFDEGLNRACLNGHKDIAILMIESVHKVPKRIGVLGSEVRSTESPNPNWNDGLIKACIGGHINLFLLMLENGADNIDICNNFNISLPNNYIYYLVQKETTIMGLPIERNFGIYQHIASSFKETQRELPIILDIILNSDLISLILTY